MLPFPVTEQCLIDLDHSWGLTHSVWDGGKWDQWVPSKGTTSMAYYSRTDLAYYYALADAYTICDAFFCSVLGPTNPNRLYLWTGMIDPSATGGGPAIDNSEPGFFWTTYPERLQAAGISWKVYQEPDNFDDNALAWFIQYRSAVQGSPLYDRGMAMVSDLVAALRFDVMNNTLPEVSWLIAPTDLSEHPSASPASGEALTKELLDALSSNPAVFRSTVFILTYDENDGFFDHLPAPVPPPGTPYEFVGGSPIGLGVRVPTIVVSPWTRGGYVCSQVFDFTSILRFLETWTGVSEPNISAWRRQVCGDLTSVFDFNHPDFTYPILPSPLPVSCSTAVTPAVPFPQSLPVQESGAGRARPLPYQLNASSYTDCANGRLYLTLTNLGTASGHVAVYPNAYRTDGPWQYDIGPGASLSNYFNVASFSGGRYDLTAYGPNGFLRRFAGNFTNACNGIEVNSAVDPSAGGIWLVMRNSTGSQMSFRITANAYQTGGPWNYLVPAGNTVSNVFFGLVNTSGWYDFSATVGSDTTFLRRVAGHLEANAAVATQSVLSATITGEAIQLDWSANPTLKLQISPTLNPTFWSDVPGTLGVSSSLLPMTNSTSFFRLSQ